MQIAQSPNHTISINGEQYVYFGGTAYLGLPANETFQNILIQNIRRWGTAYGSSRIANISLTAYEEGEHYLAGFIQSQAAITVSSGMLAGKLVIDELKKTTDQFYYFPAYHPAIHAAGSLPFYVDGNLHPNLLNAVEEDITLLTDAVPAMHIKAINLSDISKVSASKKISLLIDESHSLGILGEKGCGIFSNIQLPNISRKIMVASLGKAMGLTGGVIAGDADFIGQIKKADCFIGGAGMSPAYVQSLADAKELFAGQYQRLQNNLQYVHQLLKPGNHLQFNCQYPVIYPLTDDVYTILLQHKIVITNFIYPTAAKPLNRIVITAAHTKNDLDKLTDALNTLAK